MIINSLKRFQSVSPYSDNSGMALIHSWQKIGIALAAIVTSVSLTSCSSEPPIEMPSAQITRFILDLSGSNDAVDQYQRLKPAIYKELKLDSIGNPFGNQPNGPVDLSMTFIIGSASQSRVESIIKSDFGRKLFEDLQNVYGRTGDQIQTDWPLVLAANRKALDSNASSSVSTCTENIYKTMEVNLGDEISKELATRLCAESIETINVIENQIPSSISKASGSDVFGALREIDSWVEKIRLEQPKSKVRVIIASDMVHWTNGQRDLFGSNGLLSGMVGKVEICEVAKQQSDLSALNLTGVQVDIIGRGNAKSVSADQGEALAIFWKCFAESSGFELNPQTDGRG